MENGIFSVFICGKFHGSRLPPIQEIWPDPFVGEELLCEREVGNSHDPLAVAVKKTIRVERKIVGHVPQRISPLCSMFVRRGGNIKCAVSGMDLSAIYQIYLKGD